MFGTHIQHQKRFSRIMAKTTMLSERTKEQKVKASASNGVVGNEQCGGGVRYNQIPPQLAES